jgi:hypothetical protein
MDPLVTVRHLWRQKLLVALLVVLAAIVAVLSAYRVSLSPPGLSKRSLEVGAASSQILVDSPGSTLVAGASVGTFDALSTRAQIYGQYLSSLEARATIAKLTGIPARSITTSGPFSTDVSQNAYSGQTSEDRANQLLQQGSPHRLVFTAQEGVPIITVGSQAPNAKQATSLAEASFITLKQYVRTLKEGKQYRQTLKAGETGPLKGVTVRELGAPEGGTIGGANDTIMMALAFITVFVLGCALIVVLPRALGRWRTLEEIDREDVLPPLNGHGTNGNGRGQPQPGEAPLRATNGPPSGNRGSSTKHGEMPQETLTRRSAPSP